MPILVGDEAPEVSAAAEELYAALDPAFTSADEDNDWAALRLCAAIVSGNLDAIHELVTDSADGVGWSILFDPTNVLARYLPWLAQGAGAVLRPDMDEAQQRSAIKDPESFGRGTVASIESVAARRLTGTKAVTVTERYTGRAWRIKVVTDPTETPDPTLTEAEIKRDAKPLGLVLFFNSSPPWSWEEVGLEFDTWEDFEAAFETWADAEAFSP
jgi:hypothetical protein